MMPPIESGTVARGVAQTITSPPTHQDGSMSGGEAGCIIDAIASHRDGKLQKENIDLFLLERSDLMDTRARSLSD